MPAELMDGTAVAQQIHDTTATGAAEFARRHGRSPALATVLVGDDPASHTYVRMKVNRCRTAGIRSVRHDLPNSTSTAEAQELVARLSADPAIDGILVQHPLPSLVDERRVFDAIPPTKDVDGVTSASFAAMSFGEPGFAACTPAGIVALLDAYQVPLIGQHAVVVGRSPILGKPVAMLLLGRNATVTICHSRTRDLAALVAVADVVVAAVGHVELVKGAWIKPGAVVIDAGYNAGNLGDVEQGPAARRARLLTPVPGGVGPMTIAMLLRQTVDAAERSH